MRLFTSLLVAFASAKSFTSPSQVTVKDFPLYKGKPSILKAIIHISGSAAQYLPRDARCLDELVSDKLAYSFAQPLIESNEKSHNRLGFLFAELSPQRFDALCSDLDSLFLTLEHVVKGYPNRGSRWKRMYELADNTPVTAENASYHPKLSGELCNLMADRPADILQYDVRHKCIDYWLRTHNHDALRRFIWESPVYGCYDAKIFESFVGHEEEFVDWFKVAMIDGRLQDTYHIFIPSGLLTAEQLEDIKQFIKDGNFRSAPRFQGFNFKVDPLVEEVSQAIQTMLRPLPESKAGLDTEPFMGKLLLAQSFDPVTRREFNLDQLEYGYSASLSHAFLAALADDNFVILENTLRLICFIDTDAKNTINSAFWTWFYDFNFSLGINIDRMRRIFSHINPHMTRIILLSETDLDIEHEDDDYDSRWHFLPLYLDMKQHPEHYWPADLLEGGNNWVNARIQRIPTDKQEAVKKAKGEDNNYFIFYALNQGWKDVFVESRTSIGGLIDLEGFSFFAEFFGLDDFKKQYDADLVSSLRSNLSWIALSSNYALLDYYLDLYHPSFILELCHGLDLKRRISLMLHLSHKTVSYLSNGQHVDKNSLFFRDWVFSRLWSGQVADLKLLAYYIDSRITHRRYAGSDPIGWARILGLRGKHDPAHDPTRVEDLSFSPKVEEVKDEEIHEEGGRGIKRSRPDDKEEKEEEPKQKKPRQE